MKNLTSAGSFKGYYLYEIAERDLMFVYGSHDYKIGNVLLFRSNNRKMVSLGKEIARAENERAAREYIETLDHTPPPFNSAVDHQTQDTSPPAPSQRSALRHEEELAHKDAIIEDIAERSRQAATQQTEAYEQTIKSLTAQIENQKIQIERLSFASLLEDEKKTLREQDISALTNSASEMEKALSEADAANVILKHELSEERSRSLDLEATNATLHSALSTASEKLEAIEQSSNTSSANIVEMASGAVHIYHEFPPIPKKSIIKHVIAVLRRTAFVILAAAIIAYIFYTMSMFDTMRASGVPVSDYSDAIFDKLKSYFGL